MRISDAGGSVSDEDVRADDCFDDGQQHCPDKQPSLQFKHRVALLKFSARRWKHQAVLQVVKGVRQIWGDSGNAIKRLLRAGKAVKRLV